MRGHIAALLCAASASICLPVHAGESPRAAAGAAANLVQLPLVFEANQGQHGPGPRFLARAAGYGALLGDSSVDFLLAGTADGKPLRARVRMSFDASSGGGPVGEDLVEHRTHYLRADAADSYADVPNFSRVRYTEIYKGIDALFYANQGRVEYDLVLRPGADPGKIAVRYEGAQRLQVARNGNLLIHTAAGRLVQHKPVVYQEAAGGRRQVAASYRLLSPTTVGFRLAGYDRTKPLTIDPILSYSTYIGGANGDTIRGMAADAAGNVYITGSTYSTDWPTLNAYKSTLTSGATEVFVAKLNPNGNGLLYSTYIGAGRNTSSEGAAIAIDDTGSAYIAGTTNASTYPVTAGAYSAGVTGGSGFVTKLSPSGNALAYSTYLRGAGPKSIKVDASGNAFVAGSTNGNLPTTAGVVQSTKPSPTTQSSGFITKFNAAGSALLYSTYLGGSANDGVQGLAIDAGGQAHVAGYTSSSDFPVVGGAYQGSRRGGQDGFVAKLNPDGTALVAATYIGGTANDSVNAIDVDGAGTIYIAGDTYSTDFPRLNGHGKAFNSTAFNSAFVTVMHANAESLLWSTYFGGRACLSSTVSSCSPSDPNDGATAIAVDASGTYVHVAGYLSSVDTVALNSPVQRNLKGRMDAFVARYRATGGQVFATRLGGFNYYEEMAVAVGFDGKGDTFVAGNQTLGDRTFPTTAGAFRVATRGGDEGFVAKISTLGNPVTLTAICEVAKLQLTAVVAMDATGIITFSGNDAVLGTAPVANGKATLDVAAPPGAYRLTAAHSTTGATSLPVLCSLNQ